MTLAEKLHFNILKKCCVKCISEKRERAKMAVGKKNCQWVRIGKAEKCNKTCRTDYCAAHATQIRKGHINYTCSVCGIGVKGKYRLCLAHGRDVVRMIPHSKKRTAFRSERRRLARIKI